MNMHKNINRNINSNMNIEIYKAYLNVLRKSTTKS